jgi:hypothetical protein
MNESTPIHVRFIFVRTRAAISARAQLNLVSTDLGYDDEREEPILCELLIFHAQLNCSI